MGAAEGSVSVARPPAEVFAFVTDPANIPRWQRRFTSASVVGGGPVRVGARIVCLGGVAAGSGQADSAEFTVAALDPNRRFELIGGKPPARLTYELAPEGGGTRVTCRCTFEPGGGFVSGLLQTLLAAFAGIGIAQVLKELKEVVEHPGTGIAKPAARAAAADGPPSLAPVAPGERFATAFLVAANLVPLAGVIGFGWDVGMVVLLYWCENLIAGFYTALRMLTASGAWAAKIFMIPFFTFHYGMFCTVHGMFVVSIFHLEKTLGEFFGPVGQFLAALRVPGMALPLAALFVSHGISFIENHLVRGEWRTVSLPELMMRPYGRMIVLHVAIIFGGFAVMALGSGRALLVVLVALKIGLDVTTHRRWVRKAGVPTAAASPAAV